MERTIFKNNSKEEVLDYYDFVIYPEQFKNRKNSQSLLQNHIIQIMIGHNEKQNSILYLLQKYVKPDFTKAKLTEILTSYKSEWKSICNYDYFTNCLQILDVEAFYYYTNYGETKYRRAITKMEYKFVMNKLSSAIYKKLKNGETPDISYNYFLKKEYKNGKDTLRDNYKDFCHRVVSKKKLTHIFKHLELHNIIRRVDNPKNYYTWYIGPANPLYKLDIVPDTVDLESKKVNTMNNKEKDLENAVKALLSDNARIPGLEARILELEAQLAIVPTEQSPVEQSPTEQSPIEVDYDSIDIIRKAEQLEKEETGKISKTETKKVSILKEIGISSDGTIKSSQKDIMGFPDHYKKSLDITK